MKIGQLIKVERQKINIRQDELAQGICSPSYLSKIENGTAIPGDEVQHMLLQRLNISP
ncbi:helix-turn-helix transcriptional regulator [Filibacter tadaridae]|uniref:Helix-turn-helix protein n=1 Tax=Filibacter tadaridae TaxID=2483811 RepID=A0A3P5XCV4_9BACL|nr:helix-turn-helix transcriptional regulator [Filibacter tadaridae]VDC32526.1 helix-turn-helix protein [Filibacter tadaridae]